MFMSGVDLDMRIGLPISIENYLDVPEVVKDIGSTSSIGFDDPIDSKPILRKISQTIMKRYMSAIYRMTTVNHEHLFASMIRMIPWRTFDSYGLRQRVFLAVTGNLMQLDICQRIGVTTAQTWRNRWPAWQPIPYHNCSLLNTLPIRRPVIE